MTIFQVLVILLLLKHLVSRQLANIKGTVQAIAIRTDLLLMT